MAELTDVAIREARDAATRQRDISINTEHRQLRAYVLFDSAQIKLDAATRPRVVVKNTGQTPAYNVTNWWRFILTDPHPGAFDEAHARTVRFKDTGTETVDLGAGVTYELRQPDSELLLSADDANAVRSGRKVIYAWGIIKYRDIFQKCQRSVFHAVSNSNGDGSMNLVLHSASGDDGDTCIGAPPVAKSTWLPQ
jgi:hypothetical protein